MLLLVVLGIASAEVVCAIVTNVIVHCFSHVCNGLRRTPVAAGEIRVACTAERCIDGSITAVRGCGKNGGFGCQVCMCVGSKQSKQSHFFLHAHKFL